MGVWLSLGSARFGACDPTLFAKNAKRVGHPAPYSNLGF
jgi:hypothetical protein